MERAYEGIRLPAQTVLDCFGFRRFEVGFATESPVSINLEVDSSASYLHLDGRAAQPFSRDST